MYRWSDLIGFSDDLTSGGRRDRDSILSTGRVAALGLLLSYGVLTIQGSREDL
jgi:hypothetical protein